MDRLDVMRLYTRIVDRGSFTLAAQDLEVPRSTATQVIEELEEKEVEERRWRYARARSRAQIRLRRCS